MPIPETQLETWSHQGSVKQSSTTYQSIKNVLEANDTPFSGKNYKVFLQGSYGNDTNIYSESDVDIVIQLDDCFHHDLTSLTADQQQAFKETHSDATYTHVDFKKDVLGVLEGQYGDCVKAGKKAIAIAASGNRRKADVVAAMQYRRYYKFLNLSDQSYDEGICFYTNSGVRIANYPKHHSHNLTKKHQATSSILKPMARIFKNMRSRMVTESMIQDGVAPSYYLEGLLYNVPKEMFVSRYEDTFVNVINWIVDADRSKFVCANEQYYLLRDNSPVTWRDEDCNTFLAAVIDLWKQW